MGNERDKDHYSLLLVCALHTPCTNEDNIRKGRGWLGEGMGEGVRANISVTKLPGSTMSPRSNVLGKYILVNQDRCFTKLRCWSLINQQLFSAIAHYESSPWKWCAAEYYTVQVISGYFLGLCTLLKSIETNSSQHTNSVKY